jgi:hypothetical protein
MAMLRWFVANLFGPWRHFFVRGAALGVRGDPFFVRGVTFCFVADFCPLMAALFRGNRRFEQRKSGREIIAPAFL